MELICYCWRAWKIQAHEGAAAILHTLIVHNNFDRGGDNFDRGGQPSSVYYLGEGNEQD